MTYPVIMRIGWSSANPLIEVANSGRQRLFHGVEQVAVFLEGRELRELFFDVVRRMEKKSYMRFGQHGGVVEGITGGDEEVLERL
jgi:hypothetical protein